MSKQTKTQPCKQYINGILVAKYPSIINASTISSTQRSHIGKVCMNKRKTAGGSSWKYDKTFKEHFAGKVVGLIHTNSMGDVLAVYRDAASAALVTGLKLKAIDKCISTGGATKGNKFIMKSVTSVEHKET